VRRYRLGSILAGGNSDPGGRYDASPAEWLALADAFYDASMDTSKGGKAIPLLFGIDAVHGQSNIVGATLFPHNIGLGATRNPELLRQIGGITALETRVTGMEWTFAPTVAVPQDDRWGRSYEGYSESPEVVASYAGAMVEGLQGRVGTPEFLDGRHVIASVKHFLGDGGTTDGKDQGDTRISEPDLVRIHAAGYPPAIAAGAQTAMASFNSVNGEKMHGHRHYLTDVLKGRMNFGGFVVGDWNGHGQVKGCTTTDCPATINAGLDMAMASDSWKGFYETTLAAVKDGRITPQRLDDAVRRILRVKFRLGLFEAGRPSTRAVGGQFALIGAPAHRAVARQAVRESLVLLKNQNGVLPLSPKQRILVAGDGANDVGKQAGGWTLNWQGTGTTRKDFPNADSIYEGIARQARAAGGEAVLAVDGRYAVKPDVAVVVFGEDPMPSSRGTGPPWPTSRATKRIWRCSSGSRPMAARRRGLPERAAALGEPGNQCRRCLRGRVAAGLGRRRHCRCTAARKRWPGAARFQGQAQFQLAAHRHPVRQQRRPEGLRSVVCVRLRPDLRRQRRPGRAAGGIGRDRQRGRDRRVLRAR
jgi:beta-glucosidase